MHITFEKLSQFLWRGIGKARHLSGASTAFYYTSVSTHIHANTTYVLFSIGCLAPNFHTMLGLELSDKTWIPQLRSNA